MKDGVLGIGAAFLDGDRLVVPLLPVLKAVQKAGIPSTLFSLRGGDVAGARIGRSLIASGITDIGCVFLSRATLRISGQEVQGAALFLQYERQLRRRSLREAMANAHVIIVDQSVDPNALMRIHRATPVSVWRLLQPLCGQKQSNLVEVEILSGLARPERYVWPGRGGIGAVGKAIRNHIAGYPATECLMGQGFRQVSGTS